MSNCLHESGCDVQALGALGFAQRALHNPDIFGEGSRTSADAVHLEILWAANACIWKAASGCACVLPCWVIGCEQAAGPES